MALVHILFLKLEKKKKKKHTHTHTHTHTHAKRKHFKFETKTVLFEYTRYTNWKKQLTYFKSAPSNFGVEDGLSEGLFPGQDSLNKVNYVSKLLKLAYELKLLIHDVAFSQYLLDVLIVLQRTNAIILLNSNPLFCY